MTGRSWIRVAAAFGTVLATCVVTGFAWGATPDAEQAPPSATTAEVTAVAPPPPPQAILKFGDNWIRIGVILQPTYDVTQDVNTGGYSQNWYLRRVRFLLWGRLGPKVGESVNLVEFFFETENQRVGNATPPSGTKNTGTAGLVVFDAYGQWAFGGNAIALQAGLWIVPTIRPAQTAVTTYLALDTPAWAFQQNTALGGIGARDYGVGLNGYLFDDHFSYRAGIFSGNRQAAVLAPGGTAVVAACCRNSPRFASRVMYDFFDPEKGYVYYGTYRGAKKVVAIGAVAEAQGSYEGFGGDFFFDWPIGSDAATFEADYLHYSGWGKFYSASIPEQETLYMNAGWYFGAVKLQPFVRYEFLNYAAAVNKPKEQTRFGAGFNYYVMGQNFKITPYYERQIPKVQPTTTKQKDANRFVVQFQAFI